jgi:hypothetical protein
MGRSSEAYLAQQEREEIAKEATADLLAAVRRLDGLLDFDLDAEGALDWCKQMGCPEAAADLLEACQDLRAAMARAEGRL